LRRQLCKSAHERQPGKPVAMLNRVPQRDQPAEADATKENRGIAQLVDQQSQHRHLVILADEQRWLVGRALAQQVERGDAESSRHQRVAIGAPQFCVLCQPVDQHVSRPGLGPVQLVAYAAGAEDKERWGEKDGWIAPADLKTMAAAMPDCRLITVPGIGHSMNLESPALYAGYFGAWFGGLPGREVAI
jgi:pimeloyl-ACP methyl ester carboxylesterase